MKIPTDTVSGGHGVFQDFFFFIDKVTRKLMLLTYFDCLYFVIFDIIKLLNHPIQLDCLSGNVSLLFEAAVVDYVSRESVCLLTFTSINFPTEADGH